MKIVFILSILFLSPQNLYAQSKNSFKRGFLGGYVVQRGDVSQSKGSGVRPGDIILTHDGELVQSDFDRAFLKEALRKSFVQKFSTLEADSKSRKAKVVNR